MTPCKCSNCGASVNVTVTDPATGESILPVCCVKCGAVFGNILPRTISDREKDARICRALALYATVSELITLITEEFQYIGEPVAALQMQQTREGMQENLKIMDSAWFPGVRRRHMTSHYNPDGSAKDGEPSEPVKPGLAQAVRNILSEAIPGIRVEEVRAGMPEPLRDRRRRDVPRNREEFDD